MFRVICIILIIALVSAGTLFYEEKEIGRVEDESDALMKLLSLNALPERYRPERYFKKIFLTQGVKSRVEAFSWKKCGGTLAAITKLTVGPDPLVLPGTLNISANGEISAATLDSPIQASLDIRKKAAGIWIKVPCVGDFGSCDYDDFCEILDMVGDCPDPIVSSGLGCQCPFKKGTYNVPSLNIDIPYAFPSGDYNITGMLHYKGKYAACLNLMLSVK